VVIRRSSTREVQALVADILSQAADDGGVRREAAVARLRVIGDRAIRQVVAAFDAATAVDAQAALLRVMEGRRETAAADVAARALASPVPQVRVGAIAVAKGLLDEAGGPALLDRVAALAVDRAEPAEVRLAATSMLAALPGDAAQPVLQQLASDPDPAIRLAAAPRSAGGDEPGAEIRDAASGQLPADAGRLLDALARDGASVPLPTLHRLVATVREREGRERRDRGRRDWLTVRGAVHQALATRGSRVALYDLRESLEGASEPLPPAFTDAVAAIGDESCLEPLAARYAEAEDDAWRAALGQAASAIAARERVTLRSAVARRLKAKYGEDATRRLLTHS
jgi:hypothetical protein